MKRKGQSTLEYVLVLTAIVAIIATVAYTTVGKTDGTAGLGKLMQKSADRITTESGKIGSIVK
jgi:uncharacterized protein (UPF0333 family)